MFDYAFLTKINCICDDNFQDCSNPVSLVNWSEGFFYYLIFTIVWRQDGICQRCFSRSSSAYPAGYKLLKVGYTV